MNTTDACVAVTGPTEAALAGPAGPARPDSCTGGPAPARPRPVTGVGLTDTRPLAPCLATVAHFAARARRLAGPHGRGALRAGRFGLTLELSARLLDREFGRGRVARFDDVDFPTTLTHEPTRRFLRETGLPDDGRLFRLDTDIALPTLAEYRADERADAVPPTGLGAGAGADHVIRLGRLAGATGVLLDGRTGAVWNWDERTGTAHPLTTDVSTLTLTLCLLHGDRAESPARPATRS
ncbi:SUKH-4 family immunity protein [Streptomyces sp. NPDC046831]|uniref:SUKH-4 family immunity protein n=1 Tax=Streptomyces sp. NPDC046831 TaxID=3154805 RepID=UPI0033C86D2F